MGTAVFYWTPDYQAQGQRKPNIQVAQFGDGYEQRTQWGVNALKQNWTLRFENRSNAEGTAIDAFLTAQGGLQSFFWTPPGQAAQLKFVCRQWNAMPTKGTGLASDGSLQSFWTIDATFEQVFEP